MGRPAVPNLVGAAEKQGEINRDAAYDVANANRYTQVGPEGSSNEWITDPATGAVTNRTTMGERPGAMYDALMGNSATNLDAFQDRYWSGGAGQGGGAPAGGGGGGGGINISIPGMPDSGDSPVGKGIQTDLDYSKLSAMPGEDIGKARQEAQDSLYARSAGYLDPQYQQAEASLRTRLSNMGLVPGTTAYNRAYANAAAEKEKAYAGARLDAIAGGGTEAERAQKMALELRNQGITEAGNLGDFHNKAQGQGADQWLKKYGYDTDLQGTLGSASIGASARLAEAGMRDEADLRAHQLKTRQQEYDELTGMGESATKFLPQFDIDQGNVGKYDPANVYGATQDTYLDELARYKAKKTPFWQQLALAATGNAGQAVRAVAGGGGGSAPASGGAAP